MSPKSALRVSSWRGCSSIDTNVSFFDIPDWAMRLVVLPLALGADYRLGV
jgi:hypothetical protein